MSATARERKTQKMNTITRWNPFKEMDLLQQRLSHLFNPEAIPCRVGGCEPEASTSARWAPLVDISEDDKEYRIKAELPEVGKDDVKVTVESGVLSITGERRGGQEEKDKRYHRVERSYGAFTRSFRVPDDADDSRVSAEFKDGVLTVHLVKSEKAQPKSVEVKFT